MSKNVNIHIKTDGAGKASMDFDKVSQSTRQTGKAVEDMGDKTARSGQSMLKSLASIGGFLGFAGLAATAVAAVKKIISVIDDMKKAVNEAVAELANLQKTSADYFEAFEAYDPHSRMEALKQARQFQAKTGLGFEQSKNLLEAYKRQFGEVPAEATEQMAGYWQLHGGDATRDVIRWLGSSDISDPKRQGQILRMISATATQAKLHDSEIIQGLARNSTEFKAMGWSPEQTIENLGRVLSGTGGPEARKALTGLVEGLKSFTEEKAIEAGLPAEVAESPEKRFAWAAKKLQAAAPQQRTRLGAELFGQSYGAYVTKFLTGELSPYEKAALQYAATDKAAEEEKQRVQGVQETAEGVLEKAEGVAGQFELLVSSDEQAKAALRRTGKAYLNYLRRTDRLKYESIKMRGLSEELEYELAAKELYESENPPTEYYPNVPVSTRIPLPRRPESGWNKLSPQEQVEQLQGPTQNIVNNYNYQTTNDYSIINNPIAGTEADRLIGPPFTQD